MSYNCHNRYVPKRFCFDDAMHARPGRRGDRIIHQAIILDCCDARSMSDRGRSRLMHLVPVSLYVWNGLKAEVLGARPN